MIKCLAQDFTRILEACTVDESDLVGCLNVASSSPPKPFRRTLVNGFSSAVCTAESKLMPPMRKQSNSTFSTRNRERNCECWLAFRITSFFLRFTPPAYTSWRLSTPCILCSLSTPPYRIPATCWSKTGKCQFYISPPLVAEKRGRRCRKKRTTMRCRFLKQEIYWWLNSSRSFHSHDCCS